MNQVKKVVLMVGIPGSGKSYWVKNYVANHPNETVKVCSADHYFETPEGYKWNPAKLKDAHESCFSNFVQAMANEIDTIFIDNTNIIKGHRDKYVKEAQKAGYKVFVKVFKSDVELSANRNVHNVPKETLQRMASQVDLADGEYEISPTGTLSPTLIEHTNLRKLILQEFVK